IYLGDGLSLAGAMEIDLATDEAELDLFVAGDIATAGYLELGSEDRPADVRVYLGGGGDIALAGAMELGGAIWAPNGRLSTAGDVEYFGSILVGDIASAGTIRAVFDADLSDAGDACEPPPPDAPEQPEPELPEEPAPPEAPPAGDQCADAFDCPDP